MTVGWFLTDEHVPGPCITVLRSIGYDGLRAKEEFREGTDSDYSRPTTLPDTDPDTQSAMAEVRDAMREGIDRRRRGHR